MQGARKMGDWKMAQNNGLTYSKNMYIEEVHNEQGETKRLNQLVEMRNRCK